MSIDKRNNKLKLMTASSTAEHFNLSSPRVMYNIAKKFPEAVVRPGSGGGYGLLFVVDEPKLLDYMKKHGHNPEKEKDRKMKRTIVLSQEDAESLMSVPEFTRENPDINSRTLYKAIERGEAFPGAVWQLDGQKFIQTNHPEFIEYIDLLRQKMEEATTGLAMSSRGAPPLPDRNRNELAEARRERFPICALPGCNNRVPRERSKYCSQEHYMEHMEQLGDFSRRRKGKFMSR